MGSFNFSVVSSQLNLLVCPVTIPYCKRLGIGKIVVCNAGILISISPSFDPDEPIHASLWIKRLALTDFHFLSPLPIIMTVNLHEFQSIVAMAPQSGLLTLEKQGHQNTISFSSAGMEKMDLEILPRPLPPFLDCYYRSGSRSDFSPTELMRLSSRLDLLEKEKMFPTVSVLVNTRAQLCTILPPVNVWQVFPQHLVIPYCYGIEFNLCPRQLAQVLRLPITRVKVALLQNSADSVLLEFFVGYNPSMATLKFVLKVCRIFYPARVGFSTAL